MIKMSVQGILNQTGQVEIFLYPLKLPGNKWKTKFR